MNPDSKKKGVKTAHAIRDDRKMNKRNVKDAQIEEIENV